MRNQTFQDLNRMSAFRRLDPPENDFLPFNPNVLGFSSEMVQVINAQNILIMKLLEQQTAIYKELHKNTQSSDSASGSNDKNIRGIKPSGHRESRQSNIIGQLSSSSHPSQEKKPNQCALVIQKATNIIKPSRSLKKVDFTGEINSSPQQNQQNKHQRSQKNHERKKQTQTKNMVKNFAKSIFSYIRKNKQKKQEVLRILEINEADFMRVFQKYRGCIHSITELRSLWSAEGNPFHKAFRVLSLQYLRRHCWARTFNSRVENFSIHLKYRNRLLEVLQDPTAFTALKTN